VPKAKEAPKNEKKTKENNPPFNRINLMKGENHAKNED
ncbi:translation initiation factor IF-3, partial [Helicobacter pylori]|nr:translation initiation factor IF-3 [Helicobacter pylori]MCQ2647080.1 translation initiation factor IF-3 [Helicobacter pylori]